VIHLFINALAASAGGGLTYIRNVVPYLAARTDVHTTVLVSRPGTDQIEARDNVVVLPASVPSGSLARFRYEQRVLPDLLRRSGADILLSTGNFATFQSPVPQILLSRNALYTSSDFRRDLRQRGDYRLWLDTELKSAFARWSIEAADRTVAPSAAFAEELHRWTGSEISSIHHGFDHTEFFRDQTPLSCEVRAKLAAADGCLRLLFVSHYNYYRNFETLFRAAAILRGKLRPQKVRLILTCKLNSPDNPGEYRAESAAELLKKLDLENEVIELGTVPYPSLHRLYTTADFYVTAAYAETFAHPLVEAMASGLPVIASDLPVHREICGSAGLYFPRFSPQMLTARVIEACSASQTRATMQEAGRRRARDFSWSRHVDELLKLACALRDGASAH